jgi:hypothetical protein
MVKVKVKVPALGATNLVDTGATVVDGYEGAFSEIQVSS